LVSVDHAEPVDVVDRLLWRDAQRLLGRHSAPDCENLCVWCRGVWPCAPRKFAERAEDAAFKPWNESWTARHDLRSMPGWRAESAGNRPCRRNSGSFE
jgi:hypothetical protein